MAASKKVEAYQEKAYAVGYQLWLLLLLVSIFTSWEEYHPPHFDPPDVETLPKGTVGWQIFSQLEGKR